MKIIFYNTKNKIIFIFSLVTIVILASNLYFSESLKPKSTDTYKTTVKTTIKQQHGIDTLPPRPDTEVTMPTVTIPTTVTTMPYQRPHDRRR